jgi:hypothetical protein
VISAGTASAYQINLAWTDNAHNEMGFKIERKDSPTGVYSQIATVSPNTVTYTHTEVSPSTGYSYRICAYNAAGNSVYSNEAYPNSDPAVPASESGGNSTCFIAAASQGSFGADHIIQALMILLFGMSSIVLRIAAKHRRA